METKINNIDDYISNFPVAIQKQLQQIRETIHQTAPEAIESISYAMPAFKLPLLVIRHSKKIYQFTSKVKVQYNFL